MAGDVGQGCKASKSQEDLTSSRSSYGSKGFTPEDVEIVKNLIERCMLLYMTREEVLKVLANCARIEPMIVSLVWQKLEQENSEFFGAYNLRLVLKSQIVLFNQLLEKQYHLTNRVRHNDLQPSLDNGSSHMPVHSALGYNAQQPFLPVGATDMESVSNTPSYQVVDEVSAAGNVYNVQQNGDSASDNQEIIKEFYGQYSFGLDEIQRMSVQSMTPGETVSSNMCGIEGFQSGLNGDSYNVSHSLSSQCNQTTKLNNSQDLAAPYQPPLCPPPDVVDIVISSPDECDIDKYFVSDDPYVEPPVSIADEES